MKILFLAPQPFFEERGTPIAVDLLLNTLSKRGYDIHLLTYHLGKERHIPNVKIYRTFKLSFIKYIRPGFSIKKVICDFFMFFKAVFLISKNKYDIIHAVEESVFIALFAKYVFKIPYIFDMDSSMPVQLLDHMKFLKILMPLISYIEKVAIKNALSVVTICDTLSQHCIKQGARHVEILRDVSLLETNNVDKEQAKEILSKINYQGTIFMYIGNLEHYQGIDLLLKSFSIASKDITDSHLVIIGGNNEDISHYSGMAESLSISSNTHFLGPQPLEYMRLFFDKADVLVSPRIKGENTPMKVYSYLDSGKLVLATRIKTHTQVMNDSNSCLKDPDPIDFSKGMVLLAKDTNMRSSLSFHAKQLIMAYYSCDAFHKTVDFLYEWVKKELMVGHI